MQDTEEEMTNHTEDRQIHQAVSTNHRELPAQPGPAFPA